MEQNVNVRAIDLALSNVLYSLTNRSKIRWYLGLSQFYSVKQTSFSLTTGLGFDYIIMPNLRCDVIPQLKYLDKYHFNDGGVATKNFAGNLQFYIAFSAEYQLSKNWALGYRVSHMSNGSMYAHNPSLESHNISLYIPKLPQNAGFSGD